MARTVKTTRSGITRRSYQRRLNKAEERVRREKVGRRDGNRYAARAHKNNRKKGTTSKTKVRNNGARAREEGWTVAQLGKEKQGSS